MIRFEYRHMRDADADACLAHLASHGYRFILESHDIIAVRVETASATVKVDVAARDRRVAGVELRASPRMLRSLGACGLTASHPADPVN